MSCGKSQVDEYALSTIKRDLSREFDESSKIKAPFVLKKVKIEKD
jgi:hypothetical protein